MRDPLPRDRTVILLATLAAILLANAFFWSHGHTLHYDDKGYYYLGNLIGQNGLFHFSDELRTYGYPLFIAICALFTNHHQLIVQVTVFGSQLLILLCACSFCARSLQEVFKAPRFGTCIYVCTVLNLYALILTTELLSDLLSAVLIYLVLVISLQSGLERVEHNVDRRTKLLFLASFLAGLSVMVRPANICVVLGLVLCWSCRALRARSLSLKLLLLMGLGVVIPFIPQLANNYRSSHKLQPLVIGDVGGAEFRLGCQFLKYATVVVSNEDPRLFYPNPFARPEITKPGDFLRRRPLAYALTLSLHAFALLDQDFPFPYIRNLHPWYRWPLSILNYLFLAGSLYGMYLAVRRLVRRRRIDQASWGGIASLIMSGCYLVLYLPCQPESRYSLPVYFLWSPFFVAGLLKLRQVIAYRRYLYAARVALCYVVFVGCCAWLSSWMQSQSPRLHVAAAPPSRTVSMYSAGWNGHF
jgi:hypothetical protein